MTSFDPCILKHKVQYKGNRRKNTIKYVLQMDWSEKIQKGKKAGFVVTLFQ